MKIEIEKVDSTFKNEQCYRVTIDGLVTLLTSRDTEDDVLKVMWQLARRL